MTTGGRVVADNARASTTIGVSLIVPVYNEIQLLEPQLRRVSRYMEQHLPQFEVILVESGSTDGTAEVADTLTREMGPLRVLHEGERRGFGSALRLGISAARLPLTAILPVDVPYPLDTIPLAVNLVEHFDCVLSYRSGDNRSWWRKLQSVAFNSIARRLLGTSARSINSAFKLYRTDFIQSLDLHANGWLIDAEILCWIKHLRSRYIEIPVDVTDRESGSSKVGVFDVLPMLRDLVALRCAFSRRPH